MSLFGVGFQTNGSAAEQKSNEKTKKIALTFDDGPSGNTMRLLDGLEKYGAKASFFVLGKKADKNKEVIKKIYDGGHLLGNHTYTHINMIESSVNDFKSELDKTDGALKNVTGENTKYFRPPHGWRTRKKLEEIDKIPVLWTNDPADWKWENENYVYNYLIVFAHDGAVILLHDTKPTTVNAVLRAIPELKEKGYEFVRVDEIQ